MAIKPLLSALLRNPSGPLLLAAQVALGLMIFANVGYVIFVRFETTGRPTGINLQDTFAIWSEGYSKDYDQQAATKPDLEYLNSLPGVMAAATASTVPQTFAALRSPVSLNPELTSKVRQALLYEMSEQGVAVLGLHLIYGRPFGADAILPPPPAGRPARAFGS